MKIIEPSYEIIEQPDSPYRFIESIGRTCYKSENRITENSYIDFIGIINSNKHESVIEHFNIVFEVSKRFYYELFLNSQDCYLRFSSIKGNHFISGNLRSFINYFRINKNKSKALIRYLKSNYSLFYQDFDDNKSTESFRQIKDFSILNNEEKEIHLTKTVKFICSRGFSHEMVRHRPCSITQESTNFCNYSKDKFGNEITVINPEWFKRNKKRFNIWEESVSNDESSYFELIKDGSMAKESRGVLPIDLKTEIIVTANLREWKHIFKLRNAPSAHPSMRQLMEPLQRELSEKLPEIFTKSS